MESCLEPWMIISTVWPEPQSSAAGLRDLNLIRGLRSLGKRVVLASAAENPRGLEFCRSLERNGELELLSIQLNHSSFDEDLARIRPVGVIYDRFVMEEQYGPRVRAVVPEAIQIVDTQDLHFLRLSRQEALKKGELKLEGECLPSVWNEDAVVRELSSLHRVDLGWLVSPFERELLIDKFGVDANRLAVSRFAYPLSGAAPGGDFAARQGFCFIGNFRHAPNLDAFRWLRDEIWPAIQGRLPGARIRVWGAYAPQEVMEAHRPRVGFEVMGEAPTLEEVFLGTRVSLAPLRFGAGIKGKISDSWHFGVPVVSTAIGFEGMLDPAAVARFRADSGSALVEAAVRLHESEQGWSEAVMAGRTCMEQVFSEQVFLEELKAGLLQAHARKQDCAKDWVRRMLTHHSLETPRYFGKWLELKQSLKS